MEQATHYGDLLQQMGVEGTADEPTAEQVFNQLNRHRFDVCIATETDPTIKEKLTEYALKTYPLETDKV